jgi:GTPase SAR1 family protein
MKTPTFEIKVALLGYVSAGKTTVLNALLRDKFSEVAMRRTTAGVNFFRVHTTSKGTNNGGDKTAENPVSCTSNTWRTQETEKANIEEFDIKAEHRRGM